MTNEKLKSIIELEELGLFEEAYTQYNLIFSSENPNFEIWKHFYFFIWTSYEDASSDFFERIEAEKQLQNLIEVGITNFSEIAEFNFIAGYTISIFPYLYGEYYEWEKKGFEMLKKAFQKEPQNIIYEMIYYGSGEQVNVEKYKQCRSVAQPIILAQFSGKGYFKKYFTEVLLD